MWQDHRTHERMASVHACAKLAQDQAGHIAAWKGCVESAESLLTVCLNFLIYLKEMTAKASHRVSPEPGFPGFDFHRKFGSLEAVIWLLNTLVS